ncbi:25S rRNA (cytosine2278-C5)-methyltransferase, partial [Pancytospora epiphaga]
DDKSSIFPDSENREKLGGLKKSLADFYRDSELQSKIKIQSLASCLPAFILNPPEGSVVIDAAAAPGNKTTHLCSIMNNTGQIYAFEKDERRFKTLEEQLIKYGTTNVTPKNMDFLKVNPEEYKVDYILLDPSCSGSGIHLNYTKDNKRIEKLHNIQAMLLNHALKFSPKKVVYSTCSVHAEEGEDVVKEVLEKNPNYEVEHIGDFWQDRGLSGYEFSNDVIRSQRSDDSDVGFFVVLLRLKDESQR